MPLLKNKKILLAVTGSIAIYKILELTRLYIKEGALVKIIMTKNAKKFVTPLSFQTISQNIILDDENEDWDIKSINNHIAIGKWADIFVIAPATANTINKIANGIADNILLQTVLAYPFVKIIAPAANTNMINNPITRTNCNLLQSSNFKFVHTQIKELACRDIGDGAMAEPIEIFHETVKELLKEDYWENRKVVLSGGGTIEKIDDVRFISNFSSGKMAADLATVLYYKGANVTLVSTKELTIPQNISFIKVESTQDMYLQIQRSLGNLENVSSSKKSYFFSVSAVSDYIPSLPKEGKLKKDEIGEVWNLALHKNIDILDSINKKNIYAIGFKAELNPNTAYDNASKMLTNKKLDAVCLNIINKENNFGSNSNEIDLISKKNTIHIEKDSKINISLKILENLKGQFHE